MQFILEQLLSKLKNVNIENSTTLGKKCRSSITKDHFNKWKKTTGNIKSFNKQKPNTISITNSRRLVTILLLHKPYNYFSSQH